MTRTESKVEQVHPDLENEIIKLREDFGWNLVDSQEINRKSGLKAEDDPLSFGKRYYREVHRYVKLTFSRDLDLDNLNEIKELENKMEQEVSNYPKPSIFPDDFSDPIALLFWVIFLPITGIFFYFNRKSYLESLERREQIKLKLKNYI